jgi:hypothetical protein
MITNEVIEWLQSSDEPWTRYRALLDLLGKSPSDPAVCTARQEMIAHPKVGELVARAAEWGQVPIKRHNDAGHPLYALSTLADFGLRRDDPGMQVVIGNALAHQSSEGAFQTLANIPKSFGGSGEDTWTWMLCDAPTLLYGLLSFGLRDDPHLKKALEHLAGLVDGNGWRCVCAPELGKFHGPGRRTDPCPIVNVYALKALALVPELRDSRAARAGAEMLLSHWADPDHAKPYLFGAGTDFRKMKYPFVWYDILHVADVLSRFAFVHSDPRFIQMIGTITAQADPQGRYTASSMYQSWKGWSFADKKNPSSWLTCLVYTILKRVNVEG